MNNFAEEASEPIEKEKAMSRLEIKNPPEFINTVYDLDKELTAFSTHFQIFIKPAFAPEGRDALSVKKWKEFAADQKERDRQLETMARAVDPNPEMRSLRDMSEVVNPNIRRKRNEDIINNFNLNLTEEINNLRILCLYGNPEDLEAKVSDMVNKYGSIYRPDHKEEAMKRFVKAYGYREEGDEKWAENTFAAGREYALPKTRAEKLRNLTEIKKKFDASSENKPEGLYTEVTDYLIEKFPGRVIPSTEIKQDDDRIFYLPQLHLKARFSNRPSLLAPEGVPTLLIEGWHALPLHPGLLVIPEETAFPDSELKAIEHKRLELNQPYGDFLKQVLNDGGEPDPDEVISLPGKAEVKLQQQLILKGKNYEKPTRKDLLDAGYVFVNIIGNGEKPIIKAEIKVHGQTIDLAKEPFLTQEMLDAALTMDAEELKGLGVSPPEIAMDMADLLHKPAFFIWKQTEKIKAEVGAKSDLSEAEKRSLIETRIKKLHQDWQEGKNENYWEKVDQIEEEIREKNGTMGETEIRTSAIVKADEIFASGGLKTPAREMPLQTFMVNRGMEHMNFQTCPFLNCGHHLGLNNDQSFVNPKGPSPAIRLSTVVAHLATHGLSERGHSMPDSFDQQYMTMREYYDLVMASSLK